MVPIAIHGGGSVKLTDRQKQDLIATKDFWVFAVESGVDVKFEWPDFHRIAHLQCSCFFCEYHRNEFNCDFCKYDDICEKKDYYCKGCLDCYLYKKDLCNKMDNSCYIMWESCGDVNDRKKYAKQILDAIEEFIRSEVD